MPVTLHAPKKTDWIRDSLRRQARYSGPQLVTPQVTQRILARRRQVKLDRMYLVAATGAAFALLLAA